MGKPCLPFRVDPGQNGVLVGILEVASNENLILISLSKARVQHSNKTGRLRRKLQEWFDPGARSDKIWSLSIS